MPVGPLELGIILVIIIIIFGVGKLPQIGGALGQGIREFRETARPEDGEDDGAERSKPLESKVSASEPAKEEL